VVLVSLLTRKRNPRRTAGRRTEALLPALRFWFKKPEIQTTSHKRDQDQSGAVKHPVRFWLFFFTNLSKNPFHRGKRNRISIPGSSPQCSSGVVSDTSTQQRAVNGPRRGH